MHIGDIDCIIYPPPNNPNNPNPNPNPTTGGGYLELSDLVVSLTRAGFLTDHLSLPHNYYRDIDIDIDSGTDGMDGGSPKKKRHKSKSHDSDSGSSSSSRSGAATTASKQHASYMGMCVLHPEGSSNNNTEPSIHRRIDIKVGICICICVCVCVGIFVYVHM